MGIKWMSIKEISIHPNVKEAIIKATEHDLARLMSEERGRRVRETGDLNAGFRRLGTCAALIHNVLTCRELVNRMVWEAEGMLNKSNALRQPQASL